MSGRRSRAPHGDAVVRGAARGGDARGADHLRVNDGAVGDGVVSRPTEARICGAHPGVVRFPPRARRASARARRGVRDARGPERRPGTHRRGGAGDGRHGDPGGFSRRRAGPYASATGGEGRGRAERDVVRVFSRVTGWELPDAPRHPAVDFLPPREQTVFRARLKTETTRGRPGGPNASRRECTEKTSPRHPRPSPPHDPSSSSPDPPSVDRAPEPAPRLRGRSRASVSIRLLSPPPAALRSFGSFSSLLPSRSSFFSPPSESPESSIHPTGALWCVIRILRAS